MNIQLESLTKSLIILLSIFIMSLIYYTVHIGNKHIKKQNKIKINRTKIIPIIVGIVSLYIFLLLMKKYSILADTVSTIIISAILAYLFNPVVNYLEKYKISRGWGVLIIYLIIIGIIFVLAFSIIPKTGREMKRLMTTLPIYIEDISEKSNDLYARYYIKFDNMPPIFKSIGAIVLNNINDIKNVVIKNISKFFEGMVSTFPKIVNLVLTPIVTFYFLKDKEFFTNKLFLTIPKKHRKDLKELFIEIDSSLSQFIRGRMILALYVGVATTILLLILRIEFAVIIGILTGIADIIPYFGPMLGFLPAVFFASLSSPIKALWVSILFVLIQWVENNVLAPKIIGKTTGIHPLTILLSLIIGGGIFGVMGMIFSIPVVAVVKILIEFFIGKIEPPNLEE